MTRPRPARHATRAIALAFLDAPDQTRWIRDLRSIGLPESSVYGAVRLLEQRGWLVEVSRVGKRRQMRLAAGADHLARMMIGLPRTDGRHEQQQQEAG